MSLEICVDPYSGYKANERPRQFTLDEDTFVIETVEEQWRSPEAEYSKVRTMGGKYYLLRYEECRDPMLYKRATSGIDGNFSLGALAPGAYKLFAWEALPNGAELNVDFLKQYEERGLPVAIETEMQLKTVLPLIPDEKK
jgi:hypothetical protein